MERIVMDIEAENMRLGAVKQETRAYTMGTEVPFYEKREIVYASLKSFVILPDFDSPSCASTDSEIFFADKGQHHVTKEAKKVCSECPHLAPCRDFAIEHIIPYGVWGGTTSKERMGLRRLLDG